jgi:peroxiredoxin Q/BCP
MDTGDVVPDFELADQYGSLRRLSELVAGGPIVLFFYPAAMTRGCTAESCHFRDLASEFAAAGAGRVGISADSVDKQHQFSEMHNFDYPLLSDPDGAVAKIFGVRRSFGPLRTKRWTFVIDSDRTVLQTIKSETNMDRHADEALAFLAARTPR